MILYSQWVDGALRHSPKEPIQIQPGLTHELAGQTARDAYKSSGRITLLVVAVVATIVVMPMFFLGNASGHDFQFHLASWLDVAGQWRGGILYPRWAEWANWGFGEPRFIFYPPVSWVLGAGLGTILPWRMASGVFIWLTLVLAGFAMGRLAREWLSVQQTMLAAVLFAVNPYHLVIVYYRSDFAELFASAIFPLIVLGALRVMRDGWRRVPELAIWFAAIWLSNAPAAVIATYALVLLLAVGCAIHRNLRPLIQGGAAMTMGFGLAAFYILPAAWEQRWIQIMQVLGENLRPGQNFLFAHANDPEFVLFNWKVSAVAMGVILVTGIAAVFASRYRRKFAEFWWMLLALSAASAFLMFPPSAFLWEHLPKLQFVQFPWRWLVPLSIAFAFFVPAAANSSRKLWVASVAFLILLAAIGTAVVKDAWWDSEDIPVLADGIRSGHGYEGTDEYQPLGCDRYELPGIPPFSENGSDSETPNFDATTPTARIAILDTESGDVVPANGIHLDIGRWTSERKVFGVQTGQPVTLALRLVNYPAWKVQVDGKSSRTDSLAQTAQLLVAIPAGTHVVDVQFRSTWDRVAGDAISGLSAFVLLGFSAFVRRKRESINQFGEPMVTAFLKGTLE